MVTKIVEVPMSDKKIAEERVNEALAKIDGTISKIIALDDRRLMVFYEGEATDDSGEAGGGADVPSEGTGIAGTSDIDALF